MPSLTALTHNIQTSCVITVSLPGTSKFSIIVTRVETDNNGLLISGYDWKTNKIYSRLAYNSETQAHFKHDMKAQSLLPVVGDSVICVDPETKVETRGFVKSFSRGQFGILFAGTRSIEIMSYGHFQKAPSAFSVETDPASPLREWTIASHREHKTFSKGSTCFHAKIKRGNQVVIGVDNDGNGDQDVIYAISNNDDVHEFIDKATEWYNKYSGKTNVRTPFSDWILWETDYRRFGYTETEYFNILTSYQNEMK